MKTYLISYISNRRYGEIDTGTSMVQADTLEDALVQYFAWPGRTGAISGVIEVSDKFPTKVSELVEKYNK